MKVAKIVSVILALHVIVLGFFFYKPPAYYFLIICLSTVIVWSVVFSFSSGKRRAGIIAGLLLQVAIQQAAFHTWASDQNVWWPLAQFLALQYVMALRLASD